jgi:transmembrane sensor
MDIKYLNYSVEELADDREFIAWVLQGKNSRAWELFLSEYPDLRFTAGRARKILEVLRDRRERLSPEDILKIWKNIDAFNHLAQHPQRQFKIHTILRYAAVIFLVLSIGSAGYWFSNQKQKTYDFKSNYKTDTRDQSYLFLSNGLKVDLEKKDSKIALNADKKIVIDDEQEIDLSKTSASDKLTMNEVVIPFGKKSQLLLEDGTKVWINAGSRMAFPTKFTGNKREVYLEGEAYFEVAHNQEKPFIVNTNDINVKVLGTKFNISAYRSDNLIETVLIEGKVAIKEQSTLGFLKRETILSPNQKADFSMSDHTITVNDEADVENVIAWTEGWFKFRRQDINNVFNRLERYYNVHFVFEHEFSSADQISGKLDLKESIEEVMKALADVSNFHYRINESIININK